MHITTTSTTSAAIATATTTNYILISAEFLFCWLFIELIFLLKKWTNHRFKATPSNLPIQ